MSSRKRSNRSSLTSHWRMSSPLKELRCGECLIHIHCSGRMKRAQDVPLPPPPQSLYLATIAQMRTTSSSWKRSNRSSLTSCWRMGSPLKLLHCGECLIHSAVVLERMRRAQDIPFPPPPPQSLYSAAIAQMRMTLSSRKRSNRSSLMRHWRMSSPLKVLRPGEYPIHTTIVLGG